MSWLRWWEGTVTDPKWRVVAARSGRPVGDVVAVWAFVLETARANDGELLGLDVEIAGACLGYDPDDVQRILDAMRAKGSISETGVTNWRKRQPKREDDSRERVAEWRARKRSEEHDVTRRNASQEPVTRRNAPEAEAEAEAEAEKIPPTPDAGAPAPARDPPLDLEAECRAILGGKAPPRREPRDSDFPMLDGFERVDVLAACRDWATDPTAQALKRWKPLTGWARSAQDSRLATAARVANAGRAGQRGPPDRPAKVTVFGEMLAKARQEAACG